MRWAQARAAWVAVQPHQTKWRSAKKKWNGVCRSAKVALTLTENIRHRHPSFFLFEFCFSLIVKKNTMKADVFLFLSVSTCHRQSGGLDTTTFCRWSFCFKRAYSELNLQVYRYRLYELIPQDSRAEYKLTIKVNRVTLLRPKCWPYNSLSF